MRARSLRASSILSANLFLCSTKICALSPRAAPSIRYFKVRPEDTQGRLLYALGDGQWDIPKLRVLLEKIIPEHGVMEGYEVEHEFPGLGHRTMYLNARQVFYKEGAETTILLGIEDVTERRILEREKDELLRQKDSDAGGNAAPHRQQPANHCKHHLDESANGAIGRDARSSAGRSQARHLDCGRAAAAPCLGVIGPIDMVPYLSKLCETLATSMIGDNRPITIKVIGEGAVRLPARPRAWLDRHRACYECSEACVPQP